MSYKSSKFRSWLNITNEFQGGVVLHAFAYANIGCLKVNHLWQNSMNYDVINMHYSFTFNSHVMPHCCCTHT